MGYVWDQLVEWLAWAWETSPIVVIVLGGSFAIVLLRWLFKATNLAGAALAEGFREGAREEQRGSSD